MPHADRKDLFIGGSTALLAVLLWHATFSLLGLPPPMSPGLKVGSMIVFVGCYFLCRDLATILFVLFGPKQAAPKANPAREEDQENSLSYSPPSQVAPYRSRRPRSRLHR